METKKQKPSCHYFTRHGDNGTTSLANGQRVPKNDCRVEAYGTIDELNAHVGMLTALLNNSNEQITILNRIQRTLMSIEAALANPETIEWNNEHIETSFLEECIKKLELQAPHPHLFVVPGGSVQAAQAHVCRTVCRRAERCIVAVKNSQTTTQVMKYINRLSDYFFALALTLKHN